jgi:hypothetical protein
MFLSYRFLQFQGEAHVALRIRRTGFAGYCEERATAPVLN